MIHGKASRFSRSGLF
jgi:hypothetical protein